MTIVATGGVGFVGSALVQFLISDTANELVNVDKLTYAGDLAGSDDLFRENTVYEPGSPHTTGKAGSNHLVSA